MADTSGGVAETAPRRGMLFSPSSRRMVLARVGAGGLGALLAGRYLGAFAQDATPEPLPAPLDAWHTVWTLDPAGADAIYTADAVLEDIPGGAEYHGPSEIRAHIEDDFAALSDRAFEARTALVAGDLAAAEIAYSGAYTGAYPGLPPGNGQAVSLRVAAIFELDGDRIRRESHFYDAYTFLVQLGLLPSPGAEATPAA